MASGLTAGSREEQKATVEQLKAKLAEEQRKLEELETAEKLEGADAVLAVYEAAEAASKLAESATLPVGRSCADVVRRMAAETLRAYEANVVGFQAPASASAERQVSRNDLDAWFTHVGRRNALHVDPIQIPPAATAPEGSRDAPLHVDTQPQHGRRRQAVLESEGEEEVEEWGEL